MEPKVSKRPACIFDLSSIKGKKVEIDFMKKINLEMGNKVRMQLDDLSQFDILMNEIYCL